MRRTRRSATCPRRSSTVCQSRPDRPISTSSDPSTYHTGLGRVDVRPFLNDTFTVRYSLNDRLDENNGSSTGFGSLFATNQDLVDTNLAVSNAHIFSSSMLNEARFSLVRRDLGLPGERSDQSDGDHRRGVHDRGPDELPAVARDQRVSVLGHDDVDALEAHAEVWRRHPLQRRGQPGRPSTRRAPSTSTTCRRT